MEIINVEIPYKMSDTIKIYAIGDEHIGTKHCDEEALIAKVEEIGKEPNAYWIGMGDKCECITPKDKRWSYGAIPNWLSIDNIARCQEDRYTEIFYPIRKKCLGLLEGNHEVSIRDYNHDDVHSNICKNLGVPSLGYSAFLRVKLKRKNSGEYRIITGFVTHGSGGGVTKGSKISRLNRIMDDFEADFYAHGHTHEIITDEKPRLGLSSHGNFVAKVKVGAMTGCWFRTYTEGLRASYGERKNYPPSMIGCPVFVINPNTGGIKVTR